MANAQFEVLGPESSVIYYNLNKQFSTVKKLIITKEIILDSFESGQIRNLFEDLSQTTLDSYNGELREKDIDNMFREDFQSEFYRTVQDELTRIHQSLSEIKLQNYNFMSAVSNVQFTVTLRTSSTSFHRYYVEKGAILNNIKQLMKEYLEFEGTAFNPSRVRNFQIEIYETIEAFKHVYLKKEGDSLILSTSFGFPRLAPSAYQIGPELYFSKGESFQFYKNAQTTAVLRDHTKIQEVEITPQEKILSNEDLVAVNNATKSINDALIEIIITRKGDPKIVNVSLLDNTLYNANDNGIILNRSSTSGGRISIVTLRDHRMEETPHPKYLLIRNQEEVRELFDQIKMLSYYKGLIFNSNFYHPLLDALGTQFDLDMLIYFPKLQKNFDTSINFDEVFIEGGQQQQQGNPFSSIIDDQKKEEPSFLDTLNSMDLNTPTQRPQQTNQANQNIASIAQGIVSSPNASTSRQATSSVNNWPDSTPSLGGGEKKSAIGMLAAAVVGNDNKPVVEEKPQEPQVDYSSSSLVMNEVTSNDINPMKFDEFDAMKQQHEAQPQTSMPTNQSVKLLTTPSVGNDAYFVDINTISQVAGQAELFYLVTSAQDMRNPSIKYVMPVSLASWNETQCYYLINNPVDYFLAKDNNKDYFVNLSQIESHLREGFLKHSIERLGKCSVIVLKDDLELLKPHISKLVHVFVKDLVSPEEVGQVKQVLEQFGSTPTTSFSY